MQSKTNEQALEAAIERALTGISQEQIKADSNWREAMGPYDGKGFNVGFAADYNAKYALDELRFGDFLESTQDNELEKLKATSDWKLKILERYDRMAKKYGTLRLLRKGLEVEDAHFSLLYPSPLASRHP